MELNGVYVDGARTFGALYFAGIGEAEYGRINGIRRVVSRSYHLYSQRQRADNVTVILPSRVEAKTFEYDQPVKLVNPRLEAQGKRAGSTGSYTDYMLYADDLISV